MVKTISALRYLACVEIDKAAGRARLRYITDLPGQELVYRDKLMQARSYLAAVALDPDAAKPVFVAGEARATRSTAFAAATAINEEGTLWVSVRSPAIEELRINGKMTIAEALGDNDAGTRDAIGFALTAAIAALDAY